MAEDAEPNNIDKLMDAILTTDLDILISQTDTFKEGTDKLHYMWFNISKYKGSAASAVNLARCITGILQKHLNRRWHMKCVLLIYLATIRSNLK